MAKKNTIAPVFKDEDFSTELLTQGKAEAVKVIEANRRDGFLNDVTMIKLALDKEFEKAGIVNKEDMVHIVLRPIGRVITKDKTKNPVTETTTGIRYLVLNGNTPATIRLTFDQFAVFKTELGLDIVTGTMENGTDIFGTKFNGDIVIKKTAIIRRQDTSIKFPVKYYNEFNPKNEDGTYIERVPTTWNKWLYDCSIGEENANKFVTIKEGRSWGDAVQKADRKNLPFDTKDGRAEQTEDQSQANMDAVNDIVIPSGMADRFIPYTPSDQEGASKLNKQWAFPAVEYIVEYQPYNITKSAPKKTTM